MAPVRLTVSPLGIASGEGRGAKKTEQLMATNLTSIHTDSSVSALLQPAESIHNLLETVSLYLHIPFCHTRCYYCDFNTYAGLLPLRESYVRALLSEITLAGEAARYGGDAGLLTGQPRRARTIFFGGGTPSLLT